MKTIIYLTFDGNGHDALNFYADVLGAKIGMAMKFGEMPPDDDLVISDDIKDRLAHGNVTFGSSTIMISDTWDIGDFKGHSGFDIHLAVNSVEKANAIFARLSDGGTVGMPMAETFWAAAFGTCHDKFGVPWQVNCDHPS